MRALILKSLLVAGLFGAAGAHAQSTAFPGAKPISFVIPFAAGGSTDTLGRQFATRLGTALATNVIVENRTGGSGTVGGAYVAAAPADGYTVLLGVDTSILTRHLEGLKYDGERDFKPLGMIAITPVSIAAGPQVPVQSFRELVALVRANPGKFDYGTSGVGGTAHLIGSMLKRDGGMDMVHVPYKSGSQAIQDILGGRVPLVITAPISVSQTPQIRVLAVFTDTRIPTLPNVPTAKEEGVPIAISSVFGVFAPAATPQPVVNTLNQAIAKVAMDEGFRAEISKGGFVPATDPSVAHLAKLVAEGNANMEAAFKSLGIKPE